MRATTARGRVARPWPARSLGFCNGTAAPWRTAGRRALCRKALVQLLATSATCGLAACRDLVRAAASRHGRVYPHASRAMAMRRDKERCDRGGLAWWRTIGFAHRRERSWQAPTCPLGWQRSHHGQRHGPQRVAAPGQLQPRERRPSHHRFRGIALAGVDPRGCVLSPKQGRDSRLLEHERGHAVRAPLRAGPTRGCPQPPCSRSRGSDSLARGVLCAMRARDEPAYGCSRRLRCDSLTASSLLPH